MRRFLLGPMLLAGCMEQAATPPEPMVLSGANPAALYCVDQGGESFMDADMTGFCRLPDGSVQEEWAYFRASTDL